MNDVYITALGKFLPGKPVQNEQMEDFLGRIHGRPSRARERILKQNGIRSRHYALDTQQQPLYRTSEMAALAVRDALERSEHALKDIDFIAAATTQGDLLVPGFGSEVHRELKNPACEVLSLGGVCASGLAALKSAYLAVGSGDRRLAVACASEFPSRVLKASRFERQEEIGEGGLLPLDTEFLRWMLSDGSGAAILAPARRARGISLKVEWIDLRSFANQNQHCMFAGGLKGPDGRMGRTWLDYPSSEAAAREGAINLKQDVRMLDRLMKVAVDGFFQLIDAGRIDPASIDWMVCHYSSHHFRGKIFDLLRKGGVDIPEERWFSNLYEKGNVGSASIFIMLEELLHGGKVQPGQRLMCVVPESGGFIAGYALLTAVGEGAQRQASPATTQTSASVNPTGIPGGAASPRTTSAAPRLSLGEGELQQRLVRRLTRVWIDFEQKLSQVPIVARLESGRLTLDDYRSLLLNLRQQVVEGSRWIARAASNVDGPALSLRPLFLQHARDEQQDYEMLERDFVSVGGSGEAIRSAAKNIGSEALSAWMFHRASQPNPLDLLGAMFIIEGLGSRLAHGWGKRIQEQLGLGEEQVSFLLYHGKNDGTHFEKLEAALGSGILTQSLLEQMVGTAQVTARLYRLQLEEIDEIPGVVR